MLVMEDKISYITFITSERRYAENGPDKSAWNLEFLLENGTRMHDTRMHYTRMHDTHHDQSRYLEPYHLFIMVTPVRASRLALATDGVEERLQYRAPNTATITTPHTDPMTAPSMTIDPTLALEELDPSVLGVGEGTEVAIEDPVRVIVTEEVVYDVTVPL
jgi:hypothetical protein